MTPSNARTSVWRAPIAGRRCPPVALPVLIGVFAVLASPALARETAEPRRPNVLVLMADHVSAEVLAPGSQCVKPNLDRLAEEGVRFARCYTPNGMCSPARASLMTATYPSTHGVWDCTHTQRKEWVDVSPRLDHWAQRFMDAGYRTAYFGKWHVTQSKELEQYGWQEYEIVQSRTYRSPRIVGTEVVSRKQGYRDVIMAAVREDHSGDPHHPAYDLGIEFIRRHARSNEPFCCFVSTSEPGGACIPPRCFLERYHAEDIRVTPTLRDDLDGKSQLLRRMQAGWEDLSDEDWRTITMCYLAQLTFIDREVGRMIQTLRDAGCYDDTIVLFLADHGRMLGAHGLVGLGLGLAYEEVYRVPLIIRLPRWLLGHQEYQQGRHVQNALVSLVDVGPTLLDLCGLDALPGSQGRSLRPWLAGNAQEQAWRQAYGEFFAQRFMYTQRIVWQGDWKYVFSPGGVDELYNLAQDPYEQHNLADDPRHRRTMLRLVRQMWRKMEQIGDESLLNTDYATLRTAPIGPASRHP